MKSIFTSNLDTFHLASDFILTKREVKGLKNLFMKKRDLKKEKVRAYQGVIYKYKRNLISFKALLQKSGNRYSRLPFKVTDKKLEEQIYFKSTTLKRHLQQYKIKEELKKMTLFTSMTKPEKLLEIRETQRDLTKVQYELEDGMQKNKKEIEKYNEKVIRTFIDAEWPDYDKFFKDQPMFFKILIEVVESYLEEKFVLRIKDLSSYSLIEDLLLVIIERRNFIKKLKEKAIQFKNELLAKIESWNIDYLPFSGIFYKSGINIQTDGSDINFSLDVRQAYKNVFKTLSKRYGKKYRLKVPITFDKEGYLITKFYSTDFMIGIISLLKNSNLEIEKDYTKFICYKKINGKACLKIEFEDLAHILIKKYTSQREVIQEPALLPKKVKENHHYIKRLRKSQKLQKIHPKISIPIIATFLLVIFSFFFYNSSIQIPRVEKYDSVKIDYIGWESDEDENYNLLNPIIDITVWVLMVPITENGSTGLVMGLYNNLLNKQQFYDSGLVWLNKCIDQNRDGVDDNTGRPALTYGNSTDQYFNTSLIIQFRILNIQKMSQQPAPPNPIYNILLNIFTIISLIIVCVGLVVVAVSYGVKRKEKKEHSPILSSSKIHYSRKTNLMKYGGLFLYLLGVTGTGLAIINISSPLPQIYLVSKFNPIIYPVLIALLLLVFSVFIPIYFFLFRAVHNYLQKK
ncbi:hypothetical protein LCGC14_0960100 [marine sediment metagenome]|uniref:Uncharacterized protein n=1 Tax=marine sediment metagenome TaxID=412755 RepID=A0A0F9QXZ3_9ZZZZ